MQHSSNAQPDGFLFGFERLDVWQKAVELAGDVYAATRELPREELFGLSLQMRRAAVSVAANIAEGTSRSSGKDQARFFEIAFGSLGELATLLLIAAGQGWLNCEKTRTLRDGIERISRMLSGLRRSACKKVQQSAQQPVHQSCSSTNSEGEEI
ncbi:MAG: four helix bundle protein [Armatimonadota bacterium]